MSKNSFYKVERIVGKKTDNGVVFYKVKWLNYPEKDNTWEPLRNLKAVPQMIEEFQEKNSKKMPEGLRNIQPPKNKIQKPKSNSKGKETIDLKTSGKLNNNTKKLIRASEQTKNVPSQRDKNYQAEDYYIKKTDKNNEQSFQNEIDFSLMEQRIRELVRKKEEENPPLRIIEMFKDDNGEFIYKVERGKQITFKTRNFLYENHLDELIAFYEERIQFQQTPDRT